MGFQPTNPVSEPVYVPEPPVGAVWLTCSVNEIPLNDGDVICVPPQPAHVRLNEPRSTFVGAEYVFDPAFTKVSVNVPCVHEFAGPVPGAGAAVHPAPVKLPNDEYVTFCAAADSAPSATAAVPTSTARANPRTPMF